jgi:phosphate ABC transporter phosphate-binding protein
MVMRRFLFALVCAALVVVPVGCSGCGGGKKSTLSGGGSSFVAPMMKVWAGEYVTKKKVQVDYTSSGSGDGVAKMIERQNDFGCSDAPMNEEQLKKAGGADAVIHVPLVMGAVVPIYNLPKNVDKQLHFTGDTLAKIFMGKITRWNDKELQDANKDVPLPDMAIHVVHRSDASGTSHIFTSFLSAVNKEWKEQIGAHTLPKWPVGEGAQKNPAVAAAVKNKEGAIGYVELIYALENKETLSFGLVQNAEGEYPQPTIETVTKAAEAKLKEIPDDLRFSLVNPKGVKDAYPISGTVWAVLYVKQPSKAKADLLREFFTWVTHDGQELAPKKHYAPLPKGLVERVDKKLALLKGE